MFSPATAQARQVIRLLSVLALGAPSCLLAAGCTAAPGPAAGVPASVVTTARPATSGNEQARKRSSPTALHMLAQAAQAAVQTSYAGEVVVSRWGGDTFLKSDISHTSGGPLVAVAGSYQQTRSSEGLLGVSPMLVDLLEANYTVSYAGAASADNRPAELVAATRADGSLAAEFWLDKATKLPLERQVFDRSGQPVNIGFFLNVQIGNQARHAAYGAMPTRDGWSYPIAPAALHGYVRYGWVVPAALPGGLTLFTGGKTTTATGPVLALDYSDGLSVVSVFEQRGKLAAKLTGWARVRIGSVTVYVSEPDTRLFTWSGRGVVYTLIADAPAPTVAAAVQALPHDRPPGLWRRLTRGLARLASLVNPF